MIRLSLLLALLALTAPARAQSAVDHYHEAARQYIGGEREAAEAAAERGLALAPGDPKLQALLNRIRQEQQRQQSGQGEGQNQQPNQNQEGGEQGERGNRGEPQDPQRGDQGEDRPQDEREGTASDRPQPEPQRPEPSEQPQNQGREDEPPRSDAPRPGEGGPTPEGAVPVPPGEMTRAEAERILNAVGADERLLLRRVQRQPSSGRRVEKDW